MLTMAQIKVAAASIVAATFVGGGSVVAIEKAAQRAGSRITKSPSVATVEKDGLSLSVAPAKGEFASEEPLAFRVVWENTSAKPLLLYDLQAETSDFEFHHVETKTDWRFLNCSNMPPPPRTPPYVARLVPGAKRVQRLVFATTDRGPMRFIEKGNQPKPGAGRLALPTGKYRIMFRKTFHKGASVGVYDIATSKVVDRGVTIEANWMGEIVSAAVEIEITAAALAEP